MKRFCRSFVSAFAIALFLCIVSANAQETPKKIPKLTTDDVMMTRTSRTTVTPVTTVEESSKKAGDAVKSASPKSEGQTKEAQEKDSADELAWREQVKAARERAEALERAAEEAELRTTELRNSLGVSGQDSRTRNSIAAEMEQAGKQVTELRNQVRAAKSELNKLLEEGRDKGFREAPESKETAANGKADVSYYKEKYNKLLQAERDAERRLQLYENRVRSLNEMITNPNKDRFSGAQLEQDRNEAQDKADEARAALTKAQADIDKLINEARAAGIQPGVFR
jgi:hypothetical protein